MVRGYLNGELDAAKKTMRQDFDFTPVNLRVGGNELVSLSGLRGEIERSLLRGVCAVVSRLFKFLTI